MALVNTPKEVSKEPTKDIPLYSIYGKEYLYNDLEEAADRGLSDHLKTLKRGLKDESKFREAYRNLMGAIKDGTITFQNNRFIDSKSRGSIGWANVDNREKDYYGLMANYIYKHMGKSNPYTKPEEPSTKIKWDGGNGIRTALLRKLYNSDKENVRDFVEVDDYNKEAGVRPTTERSKELSRIYNELLSDWDNTFEGASEADKANYTNYIGKALEALQNGNIDAGDYLALSRVTGGLDYRGMFTNQETYYPEGVAPKLTLDESAQPDQYALWNGFVDYGNRYVTPEGQLLERNLSDNSNAEGKPFGGYTWSSIVDAFRGLPEDEQYQLLLDSIYWDPNKDISQHPTIMNLFGGASYKFQPWNVSNALLESLDGKLQSFGGQSPNLYYIPNTDNNSRNTALVYDKTNRRIRETAFHSIPQIRSRIWNEYMSSRNGIEMPDWANGYQSNYEQYMTRYSKEGGVIKAQLGAALMNRNAGRGPISEDLNSWLAIENTLDNARNPLTWNGYYKIDDIRKDITSRQAGLKPWEIAGYKKDANGNIVTGTDGKTAYGLSGVELRDYLNNLEKLGSNLSWDLSNDDYKTQNYDEWNRVFNLTGFNYYFGGDPSRFKSMGPSTFNRYLLYKSLKEDPNAIKGMAFNNDSGKWEFTTPDVDTSIVPPTPEIAKPETLSTTPPVVTTPPALATPDNTAIDPTTETPNKKGLALAKIAGALGDAMPDILGGSRLALSLRTNNKVAKTIRSSLKPVLQDTYELYSPVTGAFSEMQFRNRQAADTRRLGSRIANSTSDASLGAAAQLDANRQANDLQYQGFLADDKEILRTQQEALRRQEDNTARRSQVANANRASINQTNREIAQLEATRLKSNWQSWDNFLAGIEGRARQKIAYRLHLRDLANALAMSDSYSNAIALLNAKFSSLSDELKLNSPAYILALLELRQLYGYEVYNMSSNPWSYSNPYGSYNPRSYEDIIKAASLKKGGKVELSALELINKVIRDESST